MGLYLRKTLDNKAEVSVWQITETEQELIDLGSVPTDEMEEISLIRSEAQRKQKLAVRALLNEVFEDKMYLNHHDNGKPYLENCITKGYKAIGVAPLSPTNLINGIVEANKKGIYVMNIDEKIDMDTLKAAGGSVIAFATTDNVKVGEKGAQYIIDNLANGGEAAIVEGKAGNASGEARKTGATNAFNAASNIKLVASQPADWDRQKALDTAASMLQSNPNIKAIYCCNDTMALGVLQAVKNAGKDVIVVGTDGAEEALQSVQAGELSATVAQDSAGIGATSLRRMIEAVKNAEAIDPNATPETIPVDSNLVTK